MTTTMAVVVGVVVALAFTNVAAGVLVVRLFRRLLRVEGELNRMVAAIQIVRGNRQKPALDDSVVRERVMDLCRRFPRHFGEAASAFERRVFVRYQRMYPEQMSMRQYRAVAGEVLAKAFAAPRRRVPDGFVSASELDVAKDLPRADR